MPTDFANCIVHNMRWMGSEADILAMNTYSGCVVEFEIKTDREDLRRECEITYAVLRDDRSGLTKDSRPKFAKHSRLKRGNLTHPPHYYSFLVPEYLETDALADGPGYAGVLVAYKPDGEGRWQFRWEREPAILSTSSIDGGFLRAVTAHQYETARELLIRKEAINADWSAHHAEMLKRVAEAVRAAESVIAETPHLDAAKREAIYERAVSGMRHRDKQHVWRIYERLYLQSQLDLFDS